MPVERFKPKEYGGDDENGDFNSTNTNDTTIRPSVIRNNDELARYQVLVPNPLTQSFSPSKTSMAKSAFLRSHSSTAAFVPSLPLFTPMVSTSATGIECEPSSSDKIACELCGAKNSHATNMCPQIFKPIFCDLCGVDSHATKDCPHIATIVRYGECSQLGHPSTECSGLPRSATSTSINKRKNKEIVIDEISSLGSSINVKDQKPDLEVLQIITKTKSDRAEWIKGGNEGLQSKQIEKGPLNPRGRKRPIDTAKTIASSRKRCKPDPQRADEVILIESDHEDNEVKPYCKTKCKEGLSKGPSQIPGLEERLKSVNEALARNEKLAEETERRMSMSSHHSRSVRQEYKKSKDPPRKSKKKTESLRRVRGSRVVASRSSHNRAEKSSRQRRSPASKSGKFRGQSRAQYGKQKTGDFKRGGRNREKNCVTLTRKLSFPLRRRNDHDSEKGGRNSQKTRGQVKTSRISRESILSSPSTPVSHDYGKESKTRDGTEEKPIVKCDPIAGCCQTPPQACLDCPKLRVVMLKRQSLSSREAEKGALVIAKIEGAENLVTEGKLFNVMPSKQPLQFKLRSSGLYVLDGVNLSLAVLTAKGAKIIPEGTVIGYCQMMSEKATADLAADYKATCTSSANAVLASYLPLRSLKAGSEEIISYKIENKNYPWCSETVFSTFDVVLVEAYRASWGEELGEEFSSGYRLALIQPDHTIDMVLKNKTKNEIGIFLNQVALVKSIKDVDAKAMALALKGEGLNIGNRHIAEDKVR